MSNLKSLPEQIRTIITEIEKESNLTNELLIQRLKRQDLAALNFVYFTDFNHSP